MSPPLLSVVIPCFRRGERMAEMLAGVLDQTLSPEAYEIILVDNNSRDGTFEVIEALARRHPGRVRACLATTPGAGAARNLGVRESRAPRVLFLDDDMRAERQLLAAHVQQHESHRGSVLGFIETGWGNLPDKFLQFLAKSELQNTFPFPDGELVSYKFFFTGNVSVRREAFLRIGGFDENFRTYGVEDIDLGYRLEMAGEPLRFCRRAATWHDYHPSFCQFVAKRRAAGRSLAYFLGKFPHLRPHFAFGPRPWLRLSFWYTAFSLCRWPIFRLSPGPRLSRLQYHYYAQIIRWRMYESYAAARLHHLRARLGCMPAYLG